MDASSYVRRAFSDACLMVYYQDIPILAESLPQRLVSILIRQAEKPQSGDIACRWDHMETTTLRRQISNGQQSLGHNFCRAGIIHWFLTPVGELAFMECTGAQQVRPDRGMKDTSPQHSSVRHSR